MDEALQDWSRALQQALVEGNSALPALNAVFGVLSAPIVLEDGHEDFCQDSLIKKTIETLALIVVSVPPDQFFIPLMRCIKQGFTSNDPYKRRAACLAALATCSQDQDLTEVYWKPFLQIVLQGMVDSSPIVQNAALFAFTCFGNLVLQEDMLTTDRKMVNIIVSCLGRLCDTWTRQTGNVRIPPHFDAFFAVVGYICGECLKASSRRCLFVDLLEHLLQIFDSKYPSGVRRLALTALYRVQTKINLCSLSNIDRFVQAMHKRVEGDLGKEALPLQIAVIDALFWFCYRHEFRFRSIANNVFSLVSTTIDIVATRTGMQSICNMLRFLHDYLPCEVETLLKDLVTTCVESLKQKEIGDSAIRAEDVALNHISERGRDDYTYPENFTGQKERACVLLQNLAQLKEFRPYFHTCFDHLCSNLYHSNDRIRSAALESLSGICSVFVHHTDPNSSKILQRAINRVVRECINAITLEISDAVIYAGVSGLRNFMELDFHLSRNVSILREIIDAIAKILSSKTRYQGCGNSRPEIEDREGNDDSVKFAMFTFCFDFISYVADLDDTVTEDMFAEVFEMLFPLMISKGVQRRNNAKKRIAIKALGDCVKRLAERAAPYIQQIVPVLLSYVYWSEDKVGESAV